MAINQEDNPDTQDAEAQNSSEADFGRPESNLVADKNDPIAPQNVLYNMPGIQKRMAKSPYAGLEKSAYAPLRNEQYYPDINRPEIAAMGNYNIPIFNGNRGYYPQAIEDQRKEQAMLQAAAMLQRKQNATNSIRNWNLEKSKLSGGTEFLNDEFSKNTAKLENQFKAKYGDKWAEEMRLSPEWAGAVRNYHIANQEGNVIHDQAAQVLKMGSQKDYGLTPEVQSLAHKALTSDIFKTDPETGKHVDLPGISKQLQYQVALGSLTHSAVSNIKASVNEDLIKRDGKGKYVGEDGKPYDTLEQAKTTYYTPEAIQAGAREMAEKGAFGGDVDKAAQHLSGILGSKLSTSGKYKGDYITKKEISVQTPSNKEGEGGGGLNFNTGGYNDNTINTQTPEIYKGSKAPAKVNAETGKPIEEKNAKETDKNSYAGAVIPKQASNISYSSKPLNMEGNYYYDIEQGKRITLAGSHKIDPGDIVALPVTKSEIQLKGKDGNVALTIPQGEIATKKQIETYGRLIAYDYFKRTHNYPLLAQFQELMNNAFGTSVFTGGTITYLDENDKGDAVNRQAKGYFPLESVAKSYHAENPKAPKKQNELINNYIKDYNNAPIDAKEYWKDAIDKAGQTSKERHGQYKDEPVSAKKEAAPVEKNKNVAHPKSQSEYDALPSGASYMTKDGVKIKS